MKSTTMTALLLLASIPAAFFLEHFLAGALGSRIPVPPLTLLIAAAWLPILSFYPRLFLAGVAGFMMDLFGGAAFGAFFLAFFCMALAAEIFRSLVSVRNWSIGHIGVSSLLAVSSLLLVPLSEVLIAHIRMWFL